MKSFEVFIVLLIVAVMTLIGNLVGAKTPLMSAIPGMAALVAICMAGVFCAKAIPVRIPSVAYIVTIGCILTYPGFPGSAILSAWVKNVNFLALTTPILAYAGISLGKDLGMLKKNRLENSRSLIRRFYRNVHWFSRYSSGCPENDRRNLSTTCKKEVTLQTQREGLAPPFFSFTKTASNTTPKH